MDADTLNAWLAHIEALHAKPIDLGLERMREMVDRMGIRFSCPVVTVAGTNGKGSTCAMLESVWRAAGYKTAMHTSPHLLRFNERAVVDGKEVSDEALVAAFRQVEEARGGMSLSYFEYTALGILKLFQEANPDVVILEIGLGGRLDAINTIDADAAIVCAVGVDHVAFLGPDREVIAWEKAHVYRPGCPAVCADPDVPAKLAAYAREIGADLMTTPADFAPTVHADGTFDMRVRGVEWKHLPAPALRGANQYRNAAGVQAVVASMMKRLPVTEAQIAEGLRTVRVTARFELVTTDPCPTVLDVGHNPQAADVLADNIEKTREPGSMEIAVCGMLHDKDIVSVTEKLKDTFDAWFTATLTGPRAAVAQELDDDLAKAGVPSDKIHSNEDVASALSGARALARASRRENPGRPVRITVFGSFVTVSAALELLAAEGIRR